MDMTDAPVSVEKLIQAALKRGVLDEPLALEVPGNEWLQKHIGSQRALAESLGVSTLDIKVLSGELTAADFGKRLVVDRQQVRRYAELWRNSKGDVPAMSTWLMLTESAKNVCHELFGQ